MINEELESEIIRVRQALAEALAVAKQIEQQLEKLKEEEKLWETRAASALKSGQEELSKQATEKGKQLKTRENELQIELLSQQDFCANLKKDLGKLETRRFSKTDGKEALAAADATLSTLQRMENKIVSHEAVAELSNDDLDRRLAADKAAESIEDELTALKSAIKKDP